MSSSSSLSRPVSGHNEDILDHFPYDKARDVQAEVLKQIESKWNDYDVFVIVAPTATGKTALAKTIMDWTGSASYIAPTNQLIDQFLEEFPDTNVLHSVQRYSCIDYEDQSCGTTNRKERGFCKGCPCSSDLRKVQWGRNSGVYNYYTYMARRIYRPTLVVDEAHNVIELIREMEAKRLWQHVVGYPTSVIPSKPETISKWTKSLAPSRRKAGSKIRQLHDTVTSDKPQYIVERTLESFNGKGTRRGHPEERDCIRMLPIDIRDAKPILWPPGQVDKIILLSATISEVDVRDLGLDRKRVCYLDCSSPISVDRRPVYLDYVTTVAHTVREDATRRLAEYIDSNILPQYDGQKGIIHATYEQSKFLRKYLKSDRVLYHDQNNKMQMYNRFRNSKETDGKVLVACGMQEGVDLAEEAGRFQIVAKVPWPSLADQAVAYRADTEPVWYIWNTLKDVIQACGRICRTPSDRGDTIILDGSMERLLTAAREYGIIPQWFGDALVEVRSGE